MKLEGGNRRPCIEALDRLPGISNYFIGNDPTKWRTKVPNYARVALHEVYPGIDLVLYESNGELEYDWVVALGADPRQIRLKIEGAEKLRLETNGDVVMSPAIRLRKPFVYQMVKGQRREVDGGYVVRSQEVSFRVATYDSDLPLVIDPTLVYSTFLGGRGESNIGEGVGVDAAGNAYVTGYTDSPDFQLLNPLKGNFQGTPTTGFVTKISPDGILLYSTFLGGFGYDPIQSIAVDSIGNAYVTGIAGSPDFPTVNPLQPEPASASDAFVTKIAPDGSKLVYSTYLGGSGSDFAYAIAIDPAGNAYVAGYTLSSDFPTVNALQANFAGEGDAFVAKINPTGSALVYSTYLGGSHTDDCTAIAADPNGNAYVAGYTNSADFPTANALQPSCGGGLWCAEHVRQLEGESPFDNLMEVKS